MSIELYNSLADYEAFNGVNLPKITPASITITPSSGSIDKILEQIAQFKPAEGWVMYRDCVSISPTLPTRKDILEAEYTNGNDSLIIKHLGDSTYMATHIASSATDDTTRSGYVQQQIYVRNDLKASATTATYRIWYQEQDHKWSPLVQQFIGFDLPQPNVQGDA
ncbi:hypothetical protein OH458_15405 [Vibrio sp. MarTm2]|uniref:hypothetical protein n=1 Tax=Vibrio sp. MarTm2 TaxID=2998831 RepID=UPI0022CD795F|nr:hypothetical protein [Vibrio sp. MarTm2]MDA0129455.1 hypothetical protein [Vibrio sp. MarTm2]